MVYTPPAGPWEDLPSTDTPVESPWLTQVDATLTSLDGASGRVPAIEADPLVAAAKDFTGAAVGGDVAVAEISPLGFAIRPPRVIDAELYRTVGMTDREVVAAACAAATSRSTVRLQPGRTYAFPSPLNVVWAGLTGVTLDGTDALITSAASGAIVRMSGTWTDGVTTVSAAILKGATTIQVASATGITPGSYIAIRSSAEVFNPDRTTEYVKGELLRVASVAGTTLTLDEPTRDSYSITSLTVSVAVWVPVKDVTVRGLRVSGGGPGLSQSAIYVQHFDRAQIVDCDVANAELHGILGERGFGLTVEGCTAEDCAQDGLGYGIRALGVQGGRLVFNEGRRNRHTIDLDAGTTGYPCRDIDIIGNSAEDDRSAGISTHGASDNVQVAFNRTLRCGGGIVVRGSRTRTVHNTITGSKSLAQDAQSYRHGIYLGDDGGTHTWGVGLAGVGLVVADNRIDLTDGGWSGGDVACGILCTAQFAGARIERNVLVGHTSHGIQSKGNGGTDVIIRDNDIDCTAQIGTAGTSQVHGIVLAPGNVGNGLIYQRTQIVDNKITGALYSAVQVWGGADAATRTTDLRVARNRIASYGLRGIDLNTGFFGADVDLLDNAFPDAGATIVSAITLGGTFARTARVGGNAIAGRPAKTLHLGNDVANFMRSGHYYVSPHSASAPAALVDGQQWVTPVLVGRTLPVNTLAINVTTLAAATTIRMAFYRDIDDGVGGYPGVLVAGSEVTVDASTTGFKTAVVSLVLEPGLYWLAAAAQGGAPAVTCLSGGSGHQIVGPNFGTSAPGRNAYRAAGVSGAFPSTFTTTVDAQGVAPAVHLRVG